MPTTLPWGMQFPDAIVGWNGNSVLQLDRQNHLVSGSSRMSTCIRRRSPRQLLYTLIFMFLWSRRKETKVPGQVFYLYLMLAGAARFMVEFLRVNPRVAMGLSEAQVIAIVMMVIGSSLYVISARRPARDDRHSDQPTDQL